MASDEQFSLCWNNFHSNMSTGFHGLLSRGDLVDVTLAAEGRMLQAHKIVLSVCSPYFQDLFKMNPTQHPIVFLKDVSYTVLKDLLQFMYQGEVNVKQEELASFISTAEQLQVKGLTGNQTDDGVPTPKPKPSPRPGPRSSQQRQAIKPETDVDTKQNPVAIKRPSRPSATPSNASSSQPAPAKRKCIDPLEPGPSGNSKDDFVTIADEDDNAAVAPKMEPEFNDALWEDDDDGTNNDDGNFGEDDSNLEMSGFGDGSVTGDTTIAGATGEGGAVGDAQVFTWKSIPSTSSPTTLKQQFENKLREVLQKKRDDNNFFITSDQYITLINRVKETKVKKKKETPDYRCLARYDILVVDDREKLIKPVNALNNMQVQYYISTDELFDIIHNAHFSTGHGGRNRMAQELKKNYCNVTKETIMIYLSLCKFCHDKKYSKKVIPVLVNS
ncbi:uncharacterized protein LOC143919269 isoform X3 [Arctopsyche grandis]|uniref:uncharacterized protein LOC143919269 isoform X3 n=1 Tax=Arctopsyche grandis TaxID=121162 RepID=UPI00406D9E17